MHINNTSLHQQLLLFSLLSLSAAVLVSILLRRSKTTLASCTQTITDPQPSGVSPRAYLFPTGLRGRIVLNLALAEVVLFHTSPETSFPTGPELMGVLSGRV